jgi:Zn-dependent metalloprotease
MLWGTSTGIAQQSSSREEQVKSALQKLSTESRARGADLNYLTNSRGGVDIVYGELSDAVPLLAQGDHTARGFIEANKGLFGIQDVEKELLFTSDLRDEHGMEHVRFQQMYDGIPVYQRTLTVHLNKARRVHSVTANFVPAVKLETTVPSFSNLEAIDRIKAANGIRKALIEKAALVVFCDSENDREYLAYAVTIAAGLKFDKTLIVDARTGDVLREFTNIHTGSVNGSGTDAFGNTVNPLHIYQGTDFSTGGSTLLNNYIRGTKGAYNMVDLVHTGLGNVYGLNANHDDMVNGLYYDFSKVDYLYHTSSTFSSTNNVHKAGVSGAVNFEATLMYYQTKHGRNGIDHAGMPVIHIQDWYDSTDPINAFWNGSLGFMAFSLGGTYGSTTYRPLSAALDVVAHELTHGVTDRTSQLQYQNHSGALNESISDIFGYLVEAYAQGSYTDWLLGEDVYQSPSSAFRSFSNPNAYQQPDRVGGTYYVTPTSNPNSSNDYGGVHTNSGIPNKAFYLMTQGGTHYTVAVNPFSSTLSTSADLVAALWYLCNTGGYFTATTDFTQARTAMESACSALYAGDAAKLLTVKNAWYSVGVGSNPGGGGGGTVTLFSEGFEINTVPGGPWTAYDNNSTSGRDYWGDKSSSGGARVHGGSWSAWCADNGRTSTYDNNMNAYMQHGGVNISGYTGVQVSFWTWYSTYNSNDYVSFQYYNGSSWVEFTGGRMYGSSGGWVQKTYTVPPAAGTNFRFRWIFYSNSSSVAEGAYVDDILVTGTSGAMIAKDGEPVIVGTPAKFALLGNYPNPFNPSTHIRFELPSEERVVLKVYNSMGQEVRTLIDETRGAGVHSVVWDGRNQAGQQVSTGVYVYRLQAGTNVATRKMLMIK